MVNDFQTKDRKFTSKLSKNFVLCAPFRKIYQMKRNWHMQFQKLLKDLFYCHHDNNEIIFKITLKTSRKFSILYVQKLGIPLTSESQRSFSLNVG